MKKHVFSLIGLLALSLSVFAQSTANLVIFSEDGDPFYAFINGVKQNNKAETNVKVTGLSPNVSLRIEFENKTLPQLKQVMNLESGFEHTARIKRDMKKQLKLRYFGSVPMAEAISNVPTVQYHAAETPGSYNTATNTVNTIEPVNTNVNVSATGGAKGKTVTSSTTTTTKSTSAKKPESENVSINMNIGESGVNMNISGTGMSENGEMNTTTTTTTTVTRSTSYSSSSTNSESDPPVRQQNTTPPSTTVKTGCSVAMSPAAFAKMKQSIESKPFSDTKMSTAKIATKSSCLSVNQVKEICKLFSMDDDKLAYAKYAYDYCVEKSNYYEVSEIFSFSDNTEELNKFLETKSN